MKKAERTGRPPRENLLFHGIKMAMRNLRSYAMLSISIILSFSVLLGYLVFVDSSQYNTYKEVFATPVEVVTAYTYTNRAIIFYDLLQQIKEEDEGAYGYAYFTTTAVMPQYDNVYANVIWLPENENIVFRECVEPKNGILYASKTEVISGKGFPLKKGEAILNESAYRSFFGDASLPVSMDVPIPDGSNEVKFLTLQIVGVAADHPQAGEAPLTYDYQGSLTGNIQLYASASNLNGMEREAGEEKMQVMVYTQYPEKVVAYCQQLESVAQTTVVCHSVYQAQTEAKQQQQIQAQSKMLTSMILLIVLSVNLFGCFSNALNTRRFEIGVKRALGASAGKIVIQFVVEGVLVTLVNILISVSLVTVLAIGYKLYQQLGNHTLWIAYLSPYSLAQFLICSVGLTVLFGVAFAYMTTRVEIVEYLKAE